MKKSTFIPLLLVALGCMQATAQVKPVATRSVILRPARVTSPLTIQDLTAGKYKGENIYNKLALLNRVPGRLPFRTTASRTATVGGVTFTLQKTPFTDAADVQPVGPPDVQTSSDGLRTCAVQKSRQDNAFEVLHQFSNASKVVIGGIYSDETVVNGSYSRMPNLQRNPIQLTTDLVDFQNPSTNSNMETVNNPDNTANINQAITNLLVRNQTAGIPARITSNVFEVHSSGQFAVNLSSNVSANLEALLGVPVSASVGYDVASDSRFDLNQVAAIVVQPFFNIAVGNHPSQLLNGTVPANAVYCSNAIYGRIAIITATSAMASTELQAGMNNALDVVDIAGSNASLSATARALLESRSIKLYIYGGDPVLANGVAVGSFAEFRNYINGMKPTVNQALGVPIAYQLRYISDDSPVYIRAVTEFNDVECRRATQIRMSLGSIKVTNVVDFGGDEELYGRIDVSFENANHNLWYETNPIKKGDEQVISGSGVERYLNIFPDGISPNSLLSVKLNIKDRIEGGAEYIGASDKAKSDGFVAYTPGTATIRIQDILNASGGAFSKTFTLNEGNAEIRVTLNFRAQ